MGQVYLGLKNLRQMANGGSASSLSSRKWAINISSFASYFERKSAAISPAYNWHIFCISLTSANKSNKIKYGTARSAFVCVCVCDCGLGIGSATLKTIRWGIIRRTDMGCHKYCQYNESTSIIRLGSHARISRNQLNLRREDKPGRRAEKASS